MDIFKDDPEKDFRTRYELPEHFIWDENDLAAIDYAGYLQIVFDLLPSPPNRCLDIGCGDGWVAKELLKLGYTEITGVDYSERAIAFAELMVPGVDFKVGDARELSRIFGGTAEYDSALCIEVIEHIPLAYHNQVIQQIYKCLKSDGVLILTLPSIFMPLNPWHYKHFTLFEGEKLLQNNGFEIEEIVNQHRISVLYSILIWRLIRNRYYDIKIVRRFLRFLFLHYFNISNGEKNSGRHIYKARKV